MTLQHIGIGVLFALSVLTLSLALSARAQAEDVHRTFVARGLNPGSNGLQFGPAPEVSSKSVQELSAMLDRVRRAGYQEPSGQFRAVTLADVMQLPEQRRELIRLLEMTVP